MLHKTMQEILYGNSQLSREIKKEIILRNLSDLKMPIRIGVAYNYLAEKYKDIIFSYRTFQRLIKEYNERDFINTVINMGKNGTTTLIIEVVK